MRLDHAVAVLLLDVEDFRGHPLALEEDAERAGVDVLGRRGFLLVFLVLPRVHRRRPAREEANSEGQWPGALWFRTSLDFSLFGA